MKKEFHYLMLKAGFSQQCITPKPGLDIPGLFERRLAQGVCDDLFARSVVVDDGKCCVALVQTDAIFVPECVVDNARRHIQRACGILGLNCFIAATHTHSGGPIFGGFLSEADPKYMDFVARQIAKAVAGAYRSRKPVLCGAASCLAEGVAFNRRFHMKDGSVKTHPGKMNPDIVKPAGPEDPAVTVVGFCDPNTMRPRGAVVNFACHATHMNGCFYSADYVRWIVDTLKAVYGPDFGVVYLNGACGDVTQMDNRSSRPGEFGPYWCERTGRVVGGAALQALARMDYTAKVSVARKTVNIRADIRTVSKQDCAAARALLAKKAITADDVETIYANELLEVAAMRPRMRSLEITGVRLGEALFWGVPGEFFQQFALDVRAASPFPFTCCIELANGYDGYICAPEAFNGGGYEIRTARSSFLTPATGPKITRAAKRLCAQMYANAKKELLAAPKHRVWPTVSDTALDGINQLSRAMAKNGGG
ncbi:MAG TPA: hypothetical protein PLI09_10335 [Candidatus Hydrogenedentes bacterium]|nr:hypothetical protein [Candidatus Hydrogenedentota bacterium]